MPERLPIGAYITGYLLLAMIALFVWLVAKYPDDPTQGTVTDTCKAITEGERGGERHDAATRENPPIFDHGKAARRNGESDDHDQKSANDRRLTEYTCHLAIYTAQLATFTKWLVGVTIAVALVGVWQGVQLGRHGKIAERALIDLERAHIFPSIVDVHTNDIRGPLVFRVRMRSMGRSPAIIKEVLIKCHGPIALPDIIDTTGADIEKFDWVIDDTQFSKEFVSPHEGPQYIFGFIRYEDIFRREHRSWIGVRFDPALDGENHTERAGGDKYNSWD